MNDNILTYSIAKEILEGSIDNRNFRFHAWSGGARGQKGNSADHDAASYDVFRKTQHSKAIHGGPLPPGIYICQHVAHHPHFGECIRLDQTPTAIFRIDKNVNIQFYDRDGFYVHGRGPHGSDGCIVPENEDDRKRLNHAVKHCSGTVILKVQDPGMPLPARITTRNQYA
jgi:hypothetical protein